jgi:hypothetical protein
VLESEERGGFEFVFELQVAELLDIVLSQLA